MHFSDLVGLYKYDYYLRADLQSALYLVEKSLKSTISYVFSKRYGEDHNIYLRPESFDERPEKADRVASTIRIMHNLIQSNHNNGNKVIDHYLAVHGYVPLWVLFTIATFGNISVFYANLKDREKDLIAAHYGLRARDLSSIMYFLTNARNACAHGHRIYTLGADVRRPLTIPHMELHQQLNLSRYAGKRDVLAVVIACFYLLPEDDFATLIQTLKQHMQNVKQTCFYSGIINKANLRISYLDALSQLKRQNFYPY